MKTLHFLSHILLVAFTPVFLFGSEEGDCPSPQLDYLSARQKAIIPIAAFTASGDIKALTSALNDGLGEGLTINEIKEILVHSYAYAGFPRALNAINAFIAVVEERKQKGIQDTVGKASTPMPIGIDKNELGHQIRNQLVGRDISKRTSGYPVFTPIIDQFLVEHLFADIFYRDVLSIQDRELVTISMLAAMPGTDAQLRPHLGISMRQGFNRAQMEEYISVLEQKVGKQQSIRASRILSEILDINTSSNSNKQAVKVTKKSTPRKLPADHFTGNATVESWFASGSGDQYRGAIVNFEPGARTAWHTHPYGQTLIVISGKGQVQSEGEDVQQILPGDVVWIPANERHWHGASPDAPMSHVAISTPDNGKSVEWMEHVSDKEFDPQTERQTGQE